MAKKTKAELVNDIENLRTDKHRLQDLESEYRKEIKELQETVRCGDELIGKQASKIKQLRGLWRDTDIASVEKGCKIAELQSAAGIDARTIRDLRSKIEDLQDSVSAAGEMVAAKNNEIKELRDENENLSLIIDRKRNDYNDLNEMRNGSAQASADKTKEIKELKAVAIEMRNEVNNLQADREILSQLEDDYRKEIKDLHDSVRQRDALITVKDKKNGQLRVLLNGADAHIRENDSEIKELRAENKTFELVCGAKANKIKDLEGALKIVRHLRSENVHENGQLQQEVATLRNYSDKQAEVIRHYLSRIAELEQAENPQPFRRVSND